MSVYKTRVIRRNIPPPSESDNANRNYPRSSQRDFDVIEIHEPSNISVIINSVSSARSIRSLVIQSDYYPINVGKVFKYLRKFNGISVTIRGKAISGLGFLNLHGNISELRIEDVSEDVFVTSPTFHHSRLGSLIVSNAKNVSVSFIDVKNIEITKSFRVRISHVGLLEKVSFDTCIISTKLIRKLPRSVHDISIVNCKIENKWIDDAAFKEINGVKRHLTNFHMEAQYNDLFGTDSFFDSFTADDFFFSTSYNRHISLRGKKRVHLKIFGVTHRTNLSVVDIDGAQFIRIDAEKLDGIVAYFFGEGMILSGLRYPIRGAAYASIGRIGTTIDSVDLDTFSTKEFRKLIFNDSQINVIKVPNLVFSLQINGNSNINRIEMEGRGKIYRLILDNVAEFPTIEGNRIMSLTIYAYSLPSDIIALIPNPLEIRELVLIPTSPLIGYIDLALLNRFPKLRKVTLRGSVSLIDYARNLNRIRINIQEGEVIYRDFDGEKRIPMDLRDDINYIISKYGFDRSEFSHLSVLLNRHSESEKERSLVYFLNLIPNVTDIRRVTAPIFHDTRRIRELKAELLRRYNASILDEETNVVF